MSPIEITHGKEDGPRDPEKQGVAMPDSKEMYGDEAADSDGASSHKQDGVKRVEAITYVWSKKMMVTTFALLWLVQFCEALLESVEGALSPYVTSAFSQHGLLSVISIASRVIGGVVVLFIGKLIDIRGRMEGFMGALFLIVIGMIMKATCQNVETYAAAQVFYWVGHTGLGFIINVFVADITTLRNRMLVFSINGLPGICTTFAGPRIAQLFYERLNFRWAFGALTIVLVGVSLPVIALLIVYEKKARSQGLIHQKSGRTVTESIKHYVIEFDVLGMFLICAGFTLLLLPFSLVQSSGGNWTSGHIIAMIVLGVVLLVAFFFWEKHGARVMFFPFELLKDRTILGACGVNFIIYLSTFIWDAYYGSYLQVVHGLSITIANYVLNGYSLTSFFISPLIALLIRYTGQVKWPAFAATPIYILATALIIYFRTPDTKVDYLAMCQVLVGGSVGMLSTMSQLAVMASVKHGDVAVALAIYGLFSSIGSSTGFAIAGALWTNTLPEKIYHYLPEDSKNETSIIYGSIEEQIANPIGSPIRDAVIHAYGDVMRTMTIVGAALIPLIFGCVLMWRNINVKKSQERERTARGNIF